MDEFDFEELAADMLGVRDEHREDSSYIENLFYENFDMDMEQGYKLAKALLLHTPKACAADGRRYTESAPLSAVHVDALVMRLRKYGTGSVEAVRLMHEAADALEELALDRYGCPKATRNIPPTQG